MNGLSDKEWALIQSHPIFRKIEEDSPLRNNSKFVYSTSSRAHAQNMWDNNKVTVKADSKEVVPEIKAVQTPFDSTASLTSEMPAEDSVESLVTEITENPVDRKESEMIFDPDKDTFTFYELLQMPDTEIPFLVEKLIPEDSITILSGDSDGGKTSIYQQLCLLIIQGKKEFLGLKLNPKHNSALIVNTEDTARTIKVRLVKQLSGNQLSPEESKRLTVKTLSKDVVTNIGVYLKENPIDLVVIDAFSDVYEGDTRSDNAARSFLNKFIEIIRKHGCAILFVHHIGKSKDPFGPSKDSMLGTVAIHGKARSVLMLTKHRANPKIKSLKIVKGNYVSEEDKNQEMLLEFDPVSLLHKVVSDNSLKEEITMQQKQSELFTPRKGRNKSIALILQAFKLRQEGHTLEQIGQVVGMNKSTVSRWLNGPPPIEYDVSRAVRKAS